MIQLRVLGPLALARTDGTTVQSVLSQPKRFALLTYLATADPPARRRRDILVGLFWPESDEGRARASLRQALYQLRRSLGADVLTGDSEERVGVDSKRLWCDAVGFEKALKEGRPEDGLELYRGPLLEGFHLSGAPGFQRWVERERRRLRLRAVAAAWELAGAADEAGNRAGARRWAERALELAPYDEAGLRRYLALLASHGDRATAVHVFEAFTRRLTEDLELDPSAETSALIRRIRGGKMPGRAASKHEEPLTSSPSEPPVGGPSSSNADVREKGPAASEAPAPASTGATAGSGTRGSSPGARRRFVVLAVSLVLMVLGYVGSTTFDSSGGGGEDMPRIRSLAVLPLENLSRDPEQEYFADGMTEALISELGRLEGLSVISRTSAMHYKGTDKLMPEIARDLDVDVLVEGSVVQAGGDVRITLQLIHGPTDRSLWSESFQERLEDVLSLQKRVARAVARRIQTAGAAADLSPVDGSPPARNPHAYVAFLKGRYHAERLGKEALLAAMSHLREAVVLDSTFALAYAALAEACSMPALVGTETELEECSSWAEKAVELDDGLAEGHAVLGRVRLLQWQWRRSEQELLRAIELNPNSVMARQWYSELLRRTLRLEEALVQLRTAERLDPLNLFVKTMVAWPLFDQGRYHEAIAQYDEVLEMDPDYGIAHYGQGLAYWMTGDPEGVLEAARRAARRLGEDAAIVLQLRGVGKALAGKEEEARTALSEVEERYGDGFPGVIASVYWTLGEDEKALRWLNRGYELRRPWLPNFMNMPLDGLRDRPRFQELREQMGLPPHPTG